MLVYPDIINPDCFQTRCSWKLRLLTKFHTIMYFFVKNISFKFSLCQFRVKRLCCVIASMLVFGMGLCKTVCEQNWILIRHRLPQYGDDARNQKPIVWVRFKGSKWHPFPSLCLHLYLVPWRDILLLKNCELFVLLYVHVCILWHMETSLKKEI